MTDYSYTNQIWRVIIHSLFRLAKPDIVGNYAGRSSGGMDLKAVVFADEGSGLSAEQIEMLKEKYDSYVVYSVPLIVKFEDLAHMDNNWNLKENGVDFIFGCSNTKFLNFFMLRLAKESGRQHANARFVNLEHLPIEVLSFVHDDSQDKWLLVR
jgi:hypothetical protein